MTAQTAGKAERCEDCGKSWFGGPRGHHDVRLVRADCGHAVRINCTGRPVEPCAECEPSTETFPWDEVH